MVLQVIYKLCPVLQFGVVCEGGVQLRWIHMALVTFDVLLVVLA